jgi:phosphoribosyl-dephospho-CoA transferase
MMMYKRHDLVRLSDAGLHYAAGNIKDSIPSITVNELRDLLFSTPSFPAIVRRQETAENGLLCVGFSFPEMIDGTRLRVGSIVPLDCIIGHITPFDVVQLDKDGLHDKEAVLALMDAGNKSHTRVGLFGSAALQLVTGLQYLQKNSDLDIYLLHQGSAPDLARFYRQLAVIEEQFSINIDAEIECRGEYGIKLKELFGPGKTVLAKGLYDVILLEKNSLELIPF